MNVLFFVFFFLLFSRNQSKDVLESGRLIGCFTETVTQGESLWTASDVPTESSGYFYEIKQREKPQTFAWFLNLKEKKKKLFHYFKAFHYRSKRARIIIAVTSRCPHTFDWSLGWGLSQEYFFIANVTPPQDFNDQSCLLISFYLLLKTPHTKIKSADVHLCNQRNRNALTSPAALSLLLLFTVP